MNWTRCMPKELVEKLKRVCPKAWGEFALLSREILDSSEATASHAIESLPFELQLGIYLRFFKINDLEFDYNNTEPNQYEDEIFALFSNFENVISHYS